ncbi:hypothetical protein IKG12_01090 [Candidatus Saccharibacteria bacterium]|nr:hypothetical protein [Candidatus Saccharibacteria bacterium]
MENPTDPDAGTNRTNAVSRDNLMEGAGLGYDGFYNTTSLNYVGAYGLRLSSTIRNTEYPYGADVNISGGILPRYHGRTKNIGFAVRCATQRKPETLIVISCFNQAWIIYNQVVIIGVTNNTRRPVVTIHRLSVKSTREPVITTRFYIRQWIRSCTKATSGVE